MKKFKYTKCDDEYFIDTVDNEEVAYLNNAEYINTEKVARLFSLAPYLLETTKSLLMEIGHYGFANKVTLNQLENIIKKVEEVK